MSQIKERVIVTLVWIDKKNTKQLEKKRNTLISDSVTPLRLQGGPTTYSGRVEVYLKEQSSWVGICNENYGFSIDDARVLCRMLGKPNMY
jgi:hypothetical protein